MKAAYPLIAGLLLACAGACQTQACGNDQDENLLRLAERAVTGCSRSRPGAIADLRKAGPAGLEALFTVHAAAIEAHRRDPQTKVENWDRISTALNEVGAQYDCHASRLYWYTDLDQAKAAAKAAGKPILSLRMLGFLTEECSCANSRFFRSTLYANEQVSRMLRENFVLHWKSVRPVPKVTIDFGDGRKLERTLTGNSIHYVLDADGRPVEAIPGLYGPQAFLRHLESGRGLVQTLAASADREAALRAAHADRRTAAMAQWIGDLERVGGPGAPEEPAAAPTGSPTPPAATASTTPPGAAPYPAAAQAARVAIGKAAVETRLINEVTRHMLLAASTSPSEMEKATTEEAWKKIAALHSEDAALDQGSRLLIREHNPTALRAAPIARTKSRAEDPLLRLIVNLQNSIALDTVRNEYLYHTRIHEWFAAGEGVTQDVEALNKRIYAELFLTPDADPWLGLASDDVYTGIRDAGLRR